MDESDREIYKSLNFKDILHNAGFSFKEAIFWIIALVIFGFYVLKIQLWVAIISAILATIIVILQLDGTFAIFEYIKAKRRMKTSD